MSNILTGDDVVRPPFDKFWDTPPTRRELQKAFNKLGNNDAELMAMADTAALVLNFICENLRVTRADLDAYVKIKSEEIKVAREKIKTQEIENDLGREEGVQQ